MPCLGNLLIVSIRKIKLEFFGNSFLTRHFDFIDSGVIISTVCQRALNSDESNVSVFLKPSLTVRLVNNINFQFLCGDRRVSSVVEHTLLVREIWNSILVLVKLTQYRQQLASLRCLSELCCPGGCLSELCCPCDNPRRWTPPLVTRFVVIRRV